jgi:peptidylprolyl isomerase/FKBP-type peptidyl-prolyl cis-trans isomerase FkpA
MKNLFKTSLLLIALLSLSLFSCRSGGQVPEDTSIKVISPTPIPVECKNEMYPSDAPQFGNNDSVNYQTLQENLDFIDIVKGDSQNEVISNDKVEVHYTGWLFDGCVFDSTYPRESTAKFRIGKGQVIKGWDLGILGMKEGGTRRLQIGPNLAYGKNGIPGVIPENSTLIFEVKLIKIIRLVNNE